MAREIVSVLEDKRTNLIINGGMDNFQRRTQIQNATPNAATLITPTQYSCADRFLTEWSAAVDGNLSLEQNSSSLPPNEPEIQYCLRSRGNTTAASSFRVVQRIESAITKDVAGKEVTLSFWYNLDPATINTDVSNSFIRLSYAGAVDNWAVAETEIDRLAVDGNLIFDGTWRKFTRTYTLPANAVSGLEMDFRIALAASGSPTFRVTGFMLVEGSTSTREFRRRAKDPIEELQLCKRYFETKIDVSLSSEVISQGPAINRTTNSYQYEVEKRVAAAVICTDMIVEKSGYFIGVNFVGVANNQSGGFLVSSDHAVDGNVTNGTRLRMQFDFTADAEL